MRQRTKDRTPFMSLQHFLFHNFWLKLLALAMASVIYFTLRANLPQINTAEQAAAKTVETAPAKKPEQAAPKKASPKPPKRQSRQMLRKTDTAEAAHAATNATDHAKAAHK